MVDTNCVCRQIISKIQAKEKRIPEEMKRDSDTQIEYTMKSLAVCYDLTGLAVALYEHL